MAVAAAAGDCGAQPPSAAAPAAVEPRILCSKFLGSDDASPEQQLAVVLLNWTLPTLTPRLWHRATLRVCADGGANRLFDELPKMLPGESAEAVRAQYLPTAILGDLDSVRPQVLDFYRRHGVRIDNLSSDQATTDLQKCIRFVMQHAQQQQLRLRQLTVAALGGLGGRLDHTLSNLSTLHQHPDVDLVLLGDGNLARLAPAGRCIIRPDRQLEGPSCGLVPCAGPAVATSSGLRWNLQDTDMRFGGLVSSSNLLESDEVRVESDAHLVWTTQLHIHP